MPETAVPTAHPECFQELTLDGVLEDEMQASEAPKERNVGTFLVPLAAPAPMGPYMPVTPGGMMMVPAPAMSVPMMPMGPPMPPMIAMMPPPPFPMGPGGPMYGATVPAMPPPSHMGMVFGMPSVHGPMVGPPGSGEPITKYVFDVATQQWLQSPGVARIDPQPFSKGTYRRVYHMVDETGRRFVAKEHIHNRHRDAVFREVMMQATCQSFADAFNAQGPPRPVIVAPAFAISRANGQYMMCEEYLEGRFAKYNNNGGWVGRVPNNVAHAFSHFTHQYSGGQLMVVDMQGVGDIYTDLQLHSLQRGAYGPGDMGPEGMRMFFASHRCNPVCQSMGLQPIGMPGPMPMGGRGTARARTVKPPHPNHLVPLPY